MGIKEKDGFGDVAVNLARGREEINGKEEPGLGVDDETGGVRTGDVGGRGAQWVPEGPWHISGISVRTLPALRYG